MSLLSHISLILIFVILMTTTPLSTHALKHFATSCPNLRPQICTADSTVVCAYREIVCTSLPCNSYETISNACTACSDKTVVGYTNGPCVCRPYRSMNATLWVCCWVLYAIFLQIAYECCVDISIMLKKDLTILSNKCSSFINNHLVWILN